VHSSRRTFLSSTAAVAAVLATPAVAAREQPVVGISLPLTGVQEVPAREMRSGYQAALQGAADIVFLDDHSSADKVAQHMKELAADPGILATSGIVGTPQAKKGLPEAVSGGLPVVGIRSGAGELRDGNPLVFHLRASFESEISAVLKVASVYGNLGILYSDDDFGRGAHAHARTVAPVHGTKIKEALPVERNGSNVRQQAARLARMQPLGSILLCLISKPAQEATTELRLQHKIVAPIFGMSFIATSQLALTQERQYDGLALVSAFPLARIDVRELPSLFRTKMRETKQEALIASTTAWEAFFYGSVLREAIVRGASNRRAVQTYLSTTRPIDVRQIELKFDALRVGYRHLELLRKVGPSFRV
jgi:branched-chain amino acid transport system substrate-binding protein